MFALRIAVCCFLITASCGDAIGGPAALDAGGDPGGATGETEVFMSAEARERLRARMPAEPLQVRVAVKLDQIVSIDQRAESFTAVVTLLVRYADPLLAFGILPGDPPLRMFRFESFKAYAEGKGALWPELAFLNQQGKRHITARTIALSPAGEVYAYTRFTTTFQAPDFDFRWFPFDHQVFHIRILSILPDGIVELVPLSGESGLGDQLGEEEWIIYDPEVRVDMRDDQIGLPSSELVLSFKAYRHLIYYVTRIFLPMLVILLVTWFTFKLKDYVKRIDVGITTLLLFIAFNFTVSSDLPRLGYVTAMDAIMTAAFVITGVVLMVNIYLRRLQVCEQGARAERLDRYATWLYWPAYVFGTSVALMLL